MRERRARHGVSPWDDEKRAWLARQMWDDQCTFTLIGGAVGLSRSAVAGFIRREGLLRKREAISPPPSIQIEAERIGQYKSSKRDILVALSGAGPLSPKNIAAKLGCLMVDQTLFLRKLDEMKGANLIELIRDHDYPASGWRITESGLAELNQTVPSR